jgi:hypothetical protein
MALEFMIDLGRTWRGAVAMLGLAACATSGQRATAPDVSVAAVPRVFLLRAENLERTRALVRSRDAKVRVAWDSLRHDADRAMTVGPFSVMYKRRVGPSGDKHDYVSLGPYWWPDSTKPNGMPYVQRDGVVNPEARMDSDSPAFGRLVEAVESLALAGYVSGERRYAERAAMLLRTWFLAPATRMNPNLEYAQGIPGTTPGRGIGIIDTRDLARIVDAIGMLGATGAWTAADEAAMQAWARAFLTWMATSKNGGDERDAKNNHGVWYDAQLASIALYVGDTATARRAIATSATARIAAEIAPTGEQPLETARTRPLHYSLFTLEPYERLAELGRHVGVDLWRYEAPNGGGIRKAALFVAPYADMKAHPFPKPEVEPVPNDDFLLPMRRAYAAYRDPALAAAIAAVPNEVAVADRSRLLYPDVP